jgi:site-specific DNA-methyltransferase (adenine-specific)
VKPYYEEDGITIYHGDCREVVPRMVFDAVVTDPPYGINLDTGRSGKPGHPVMFGDDKPFDPRWLLALNVPSIIWGANHFASLLPDSRGWLCWDKATRNGFNLQQAEFELAWTNVLSRPRMFRHLWVGYHRDSEVRTALHPTQKPVALMRWCLSWLPDSVSVVADPYMGAGPTLRAAKDLGIKAIGIELEERYCETAAKRLAQGVLDFGGAA